MAMSDTAAASSTSAESRDLRGYAKLFWRWKFLFLGFLIGASAVGYLVRPHATRTYRTSLLLQENLLPVDTALFTSGNAPVPAVPASDETLAGEARIIETPAVAALAAGYLRPTPRDPSSLLSYITANADTSTGFIYVVATAGSPSRAADIANAFGKAVVKLRAQQAEGLLTTTIDQVAAQLNQLSPTDRTGRSQLSGQLQRLRALRAAQGENAQILQAAPPGALVVSQAHKTFELGILAGILLGVAAVFLADAIDRRVRQPEELEGLTGLPLLGVIPRRAAASEPRARQAAEEFQTLRSTLMFFNVDRGLASVVIASPGLGDGKTTVATGLAAATAHAGRYVILVDADLRRPDTAARLGVSGEAVLPGRGVGGVLSGQISLEDALVDVPLTQPTSVLPPGLGGTLRVLPAGGVPPNPSELVASHQMRGLLSAVSELAEFVVVDTSPLLKVGDALPLLGLVSGVVLVARLNGTSKEDVKRSHQILLNAGASTLGVVATGARERSSGYGYELATEATSEAVAGPENGDGNAVWRVPRIRQRSG